MAFKQSQTIKALRSADILAIMRLIDNHAYLNTDKVEWLHTLTFDVKVNSDYNPMWDEEVNGPHKERYLLTCDKDINTLNKKQAWGLLDHE